MASIDPHVKQLGILAEKQMKSILHAPFLGNCQNDNVIPKGLRLNLKVSVGTGSEDLQKSIDGLLEKVSFEICERIRNFHLYNSHSYGKMIENKRKELEKIASSERLLQIDEDIYKSTENKKEALLERHRKKLSSLKCEALPNHEKNTSNGSNRNLPQITSDMCSSSEWTKVARKGKLKNKHKGRKRKERPDHLARKEQTQQTQTRSEKANRKGTATNQNNTTVSHKRPPMQRRKVTDHRTDPCRATPPNEGTTQESVISDLTKQKNVMAPSTRKTYLEAAKIGAMRQTSSVGLQEAVETLTKVVADLLKATGSKQGNE